MKEAAQRLRKAADNLEERVRFNQSSLSEAIEMLIGQAESAQTFLENKGPEQLSKVIKKEDHNCAREETTALIDSAQIDVSTLSIVDIFSYLFSFLFPRFSPSSSWQWNLPKSASDSSTSTSSV